MSQYGEPDHYILHVSDTHFVTEGALLHDKVDATRNLSRLFEEFEKAGAATRGHRLHRRPRRQGRPEALRAAAPRSSSPPPPASAPR